MTRVALLASQQPVEALTLATQWAGSGDDVTVVLLDDATAVLRAGHAAAAALTAAHGAGVTIWAHDIAVRERTVDGGPAITTVGLDRVAVLVGETATKVQWW